MRLPDQLCCQVLLSRALQLARDNYGNQHVKFADCQIALGFFHLNSKQVVLRITNVIINTNFNFLH